MLSFVATTRKKSHSGGWQSCVAWCRQQVANDPKAAVSIILARGGEKEGRVVAEIAADRERRIYGGRLVELKKVVQLATAVAPDPSGRDG